MNEGFLEITVRFTEKNQIIPYNRPLFEKLSGYTNYSFLRQILNKNV